MASSSSSAAAKAQPSVPALMANADAANRLRTWALIAVGTAAGVTGLTGGAGFVLYLAQHLLVVALLLALAGWRPAAYFHDVSVPGFVLTGLADLSNALTFILFWSVAYAFVYVY